MKQRENRFIPKALRGLFSSWGNSMIPPKSMRFVGMGGSSLTAITYDELAVAELFARYGLAVEQPLRYGSWCGQPEFLSYQDIVIAERR